MNVYASLALVSLLASPAWSAPSEPRADVLAAFKRGRDLAPKKGVAAGPAHEQAAYFQSEIVPRIDTAVRLVCQGGDRALIRETLLLAGAYKGVGHDKVWTAAGRMFMCQSDAVVAEFRRLAPADQIHAYNAIDNGFSLLTYEDEGAVPNFDELQRKLASLRGEESHD